MRLEMDLQQATCKWLHIVVVVLVLFLIAELSCPRSSFGLGGGLANDGAFSPAFAALQRTTPQKPNHGSRRASRKLAEYFNAGPWFPFSYNATLGLLDIYGEINEDYLTAGVEPEMKLNLEAKPEVALSRISSSKSAGEVKEYKFDVCPSRLKEYVPCVDNTAASMKLQSDGRGERWERHFPAHKDRMCCLIAAPVNYKLPIRWPKSRDEVWYNNVPHKQLVADKGAQNWIKLEKDRFTFPGGGTQFAHGASQYHDHIGKMIPGIGYGRNTRVALDIGCGVASFGAYLLDHLFHCPSRCS